MRKLLILLFVITAVSFLPAVAGQLFKKEKNVAASTPRHWRVIWKETPQTKATISWTTSALGKSHQVHMGTSSAAGDLKKYTKKYKSHRNAVYSDSNDRAFFHHVRVTGLKASTQYFFVMVSDGVVSKEFNFYTAPDDERDCSFLFGGDSRSGVETRQKMNKMIADLHAKDVNIMALAHGGDYVGSGKKWDQWNLWLSHNELLADSKGLILPMIPARGNHDGGPLYKEIFDISKKEKCYFNTQFSALGTLVTLNTEVSAAGDQLIFLKKTLKKNKKRKWLLAQYHKPLYPAVKDPAAAKKHWTPIFEKYNMNLILEADGHTIKRTLPIRNDKHDPTGVVYVGEGGLGVRQRTPKSDRWYLQKPGMVSQGHHVMRLDFTNKSLEYTVLMLGGKLEDSHSFKVKKR